MEIHGRAKEGEGSYVHDGKYLTGIASSIEHFLLHHVKPERVGAVGSEIWVMLFQKGSKIRVTG